MARKRTERREKKSGQKTAPVRLSERLHAQTLARSLTSIFARLSPHSLVLILFLLPTLLLWSVTFGGKTLAPVDLLLVMSPWRHFAAERFPEFHSVKAPLLDVVQQYFPWRKFYAESFRQGQLPLWNPFMFCGTSFVGNGMSAIFYPLNLLFVAMPVETAFGWVAWLHLVLAGIFMFGFLRQFVSPISALTGAIAFQMCGFFIAWLAYLPLLCTAIWLPAALWAFEAGSGTRGVGRGERIFFVLLSGCAIGMALLAGHPQVGFYVLWAFAIYGAVRTIVGLAEKSEWHWDLVIGFLAISFGFAFGAPQFLPLTEMAKISFRSVTEPLTAAAGNRLPFDQFVRLFIPSFFGDWRSGTHLLWDFARFNFVERTGYPSVIAFLLAVVGVFSWKMAWHGHRPSIEPVPRPAPLVPLLIGVIFALVGLLAASVPIVHRFMALGLPGTQAFVGISRALFLFDLGIAILAAIGVEFLMQRERHNATKLVPRPAPLVPFALIIALVFMAICISQGVTVHAGTAFHPLLRDFTMPQIYRWLVFTALGTFTIFLAFRLRAHALARLSTCLLYALPFLVAVDLLTFAWAQHPEADKAMAFFETPSIRWLKRHIGTQRFVAVGTDAVKHWTPSNTLMFYGLRDAQGSDSLMTMRVFRFLQTWDANSPLHRAFAVRNFNSPLLDLMAVKYVVAAEPLGADERKDLRLVHAGDLWIYENPNALPRTFAVPKWRLLKSPQDALQQITSPDFDPRKFAVLESAQGEKRKSIVDKLFAPHSSSLVPRPASLASRPLSPVPRPARFLDRVNTLQMEIELPQSAALVVADGAYPGWRAFGKRDTKFVKQGEGWSELPVFIANYSFRAVLLPEGKWQVVWVYFPSSVVVGLFLCLCAIGATVAMTVATVKRR
ncbi:MAG: hypothetical protein ACK4I8_01385 [Armatimonadota bacterium]